MNIEYFLAVPLICWVLVNLAIYRSVRHLSRPDKLLEEAQDIDDGIFLREKEEFSTWCLSNEFVHEKNFLFYGVLNAPPIKCSAWWSSDSNTWALIYVTQTGKNVDFVSAYENGVAVTTASSKDSLTLPTPPKSFFQAFTKISTDERYALHRAAVTEIEKALQVSRRDGRPELFELIIESILRQVAYIRGMPFWYLRGAYWYFISRSLKVNKKIQASI